MTSPHSLQVRLDGDTLTLEEVALVASELAEVQIDPEAAEAVRRSRAVIDEILASGRTAYGVNTGFGNLAEVRISPEDLSRLQLNLIRSHACGVGQPLSKAEARALMVLRANVLAKGASGIRPETVELLVRMINADVVPIIPEKGSVGASGDLAPLAHLALVLVGESEAWFEGERLPGDVALARANLEPAVLGPKEGLCLVNGTQAKIYAWYDNEWGYVCRLCDVAWMVAAGMERP
jgi:histidine ammonia-lyase